MKGKKILWKTGEKGPGPLMARYCSWRARTVARWLKKMNYGKREKIKSISGERKKKGKTSRTLFMLRYCCEQCPGRRGPSNGDPTDRTTRS